MNEDPVGTRAKHAMEEKKSRGKKLNEDPVGTREKEAQKVKKRSRLVTRLKM